MNNIVNITTRYQTNIIINSTITTTSTTATGNIINLKCNQTKQKNDCFYCDIFLRWKFGANKNKKNPKYLDLKYSTFSLKKKMLRSKHRSKLGYHTVQSGIFTYVFISSKKCRCKVNYYYYYNKTLLLL